MTQKNYVFFQFEASVQPGNEGLVHHFVVYECHGDFNDTHFGAGYDCVSSANMPLRGCYINNMVAAWGIGGEVGNRTLLVFFFASFCLWYYYYHFVGHCGAFCGLKWRIWRAKMYFSPLK